MAGLGGQGAGDAESAVPRTPSALVHLREVLKGLPTGLRCRLLELSIQPDEVRLDGQARSHSEAEAIAVAIRQSGLYEVEPPKTETLRDQGVSFAFTAKSIAAPTGPKGDRP
jgi:hypothetical protein